MKTEIERRKPEGPLDYLSLAITTFGVGYLPGAPGTYGSAVGVLFYLGISSLLLISLPHALEINTSSHSLNALIAIALLVFCFLGVWASGRAISLLGNEDPSEAVVDEVMGQFVTYCFVPFGISWPFVIAGFLLFRLFDIWKPYPIHEFEILPGGLGICADDIVAGIYAGVCLALIYAGYLLL